MRAESTCGFSTYTNLPVTVTCTLPAVPGAINGSTTVLQNATAVSYSVSAVTGATGYNWAVPAGAIITSGQGTNNITVNFGTGGGNVSVRAENICGNSAFTNLPVNTCSIPASPGIITGNTIVLQNATAISYSVPAVSGATGYNWTAPAGATIVSGQGTNSILVNFGTAGGNISVRSQNICGNSAYTNLTVNTCILPAAPGTITGSTSIVQNATAVPYSISNVTGATGYNWTVPAGATIVSGQGTTNITVNFGAAGGTVSVRAQNGCGNSAYTNLAVSTCILPASPVIGTITQPNCILTTGSVALGGLPGAGSWTLTRIPGGITTTGSGTGTTISGLPAGSYSFTVTSAPGCTSAPSASVVINTPPAAPYAPAVGTITQPTCTLATGSVVLGGLPSSGSWTLARYPGGLTTTGSGNVSTISGLSPGTYTFIISDESGCNSPASGNVVINTQPAVPGVPGPITGSTTVMQNAVAVAYSVSAVTGATGYTWTVPAGATITSGQGTSQITVNFGTAGGNVSVRSENSCGNSAYTNLAVNTCIIPAAPGTITGNANVVQNATAVSYSISAVSGATNYNWTVPAGATIVSGQGSNNITVNFGTSGGNVSVRAENSCGNSSYSNLAITTCTLPAAPGPITGSTTVVQNAAAVAYFISAVNGATGYIWTVPSGATVVSGQGTTNITVNFGTTGGTVGVRAQNSCGNSANAILAVSTCVLPASPVVGNITQPTCAMPSGSVVLGSLPATGAWTLTRSPGGNTTPGSGTATTLSGLPVGTYTFTVTNAAGCTSSVSASVIINPPPSAPAAPVPGTVTHPTCFLATGSVILDGLPATGNWTVTRSPGGVTTTGSGNSTTISGLPAGSYTFTVADATGCNSAASANVVINAQPTFPSVPTVGTITQPSCILATGSVILGGLPSSGNWTLTRNPGGVTTSGSGTGITVSGLAAGSYTFTVTDAAGCISAASGNVVIASQPAIPSAPTVGPITQPTCSLTTGSVVLGGLPASGSWTLTRSPGGNTTTGSGTATTLPGLPVGTYTFSVTNAAGCTSSASASVIINPPPSAPTAPVPGTITQPTCVLATGSVVLGGLPATGNWTVTRSPGGVTTPGSGSNTTISGLPTGSYTFTVADATGCSSAASANVVINSQPTVPSAPTVGTITQPSCILATGSVILGGLPSSGNWTLTRNPGGITTSGSGTGTTISGLPAGNYTFLVTNASGCTSSASANVAINSQPTAPTAPTVGTITQPTCGVATGSVLLGGLPPSGTWTLTRSPGGITTSGSGSSITVSGIPAGNYTFTVTSAPGCTSSPSGSVVINAQPVTPTPPSVGIITQPSCLLATGSVVLGGLPPAGNWTLTRSPGGVTTPGSGNSTTISELPAGIYTFRVTDATGCTSAVSTSAGINVQPATPSAPTVGTIIQPTCILPTGSVTLGGLPSAGNWTLTRNPGGTTTSGSGNSTTISGLPAGTYSFTVANASGCTSASSGNVIIDPQLTVPAMPGAITGSTSVTPNATAIAYSISAVAGATSYNWTVPPGATVASGQGTTNITVNFGATGGNVSVRAQNGCGNSAYNNLLVNVTLITNCGTVNDIDGNLYHSVVIGSQCWLVENLKVTRYNDGTPIPYLPDATLWTNNNNSQKEAYCWYDNNIANKELYGALYNWYTIDNSSQKQVCPVGWHVPSDTEWRNMVNFYGGVWGAYPELIKNGWFTSNYGGRRHQWGVFYESGGYTYWWTSSKVQGGWGLMDAINYGLTSGYLDSNNHAKGEGNSIRCMKD